MVSLVQKKSSIIEWDSDNSNKNNSTREKLKNKYIFNGNSCKFNVLKLRFVGVNGNFMIYIKSGCIAKIIISIV